MNGAVLQQGKLVSYLGLRLTRHSRLATTTPFPAYVLGAAVTPTRLHQRIGVQ